MSDTVLFSIFAAIFAALFVRGIITGEMWAKWWSANRAESPVIFWASAAFNLLLAGLSLAAAITGVQAT